MESGLRFLYFKLNLRRQLSNTYKILTKKMGKPRILYPRTLSFKYKQINSFAHARAQGILFP